MRFRPGLLVVALSGLWLVLFFFYPLRMPEAPFPYELKSGYTLRAVAHSLVRHKVLWEPWTFIFVGRLTGFQGKIKAGSYEWETPMTAWQLLSSMTRGDVVQNEIRLGEGMTFAQFRNLLDQNPDLKHVAIGQPDAWVLGKLSLSQPSPEGLFFPDTYYFNHGDSDLRIMKRAESSMQHRLMALWSQRSNDLPYDSPYQLLIMASLVEKETARAEERPLVAGVFINRLRKGMRLQTDPTVIYGLGAQYDGHLHKRDLLSDTPWNTYTRGGLPPTPIAMPGEASLDAAAHPASTNALYFVSKGDGTHQFSSTLEDHQRAVDKYVLGKTTR